LSLIGTPWNQSYGYDAARRLTSVTSPAGEFDYAYDPVKLQRVHTLTLPNGAVITNAYDSVARLTLTELMSSTGADLDSYAYGYNQANQRTNVVRAAGNYVNYTYDNMGELLTANGKEAGGVTNRWQEQFGYAYDAAGNLNVRTNNTLFQQFNVNSLNELSTVTSGGSLTVAGGTSVAVTNVTVNTSNSILYADTVFASTNQPWVAGNNTYTAIAKDALGRLATNSVTVSLQPTNGYLYDLNGNLLTDGTRSFAYDDENQLISVWQTNVWRNDFVYDGKMRRRIEKDFNWTGSSWAQTNEIRFVYDGNLVIQERNTNNQPVVEYTRGNDLSGTLQGAGGIGGLLARSQNSLSPTPFYAVSSYYHADGNGNVTMLIDASQVVMAKYLYDPFGNTLAQSGLLADANIYRFSSKEWNQNSGLYYYLYRFYDSSVQRWVNRDPIGELGFEICRNVISPQLKKYTPFSGLIEDPNYYLFVGNSPISKWDVLGLSCCSDTCYDNYVNAVNKARSDLATCVTWGYGLCTARKAGPACYFWVTVGCGDKAATAEIAAAAAYAGCLSGCPSSPSPPSPPHRRPPGSGL
jgi:RHS repeat-associated protein